MVKAPRTRPVRKPPAARTAFLTSQNSSAFYKVGLSDANAGKPVRKIAHIDLMNDPAIPTTRRASRSTTRVDVSVFTIENVDRVDETHIIVGNDNNLPFSSSRDPQQGDDNEFVLLEVGDFLKAK